MIYIVRHGQTDWNKLGKIQGHTDIELNSQGIEQALTVKEKLKDIKFDKVFSSPLKRALKTARLIYDGEITIDDRLKERYNGELEGKTKSEIKVWPDFNNPNETLYNIEPLNDFRGRIKNFIEDILTNYKGKDILISTHAGVCLYIRCFFEGEPKDNLFESYKLSNCEFLTYQN